jgi:hypothetical protein
MNRLFGASTSKPKPSLSDAIASTDVRIDSIEVKVRKLDAELTKYRDQMRRMKDGPGKVRLRRLAIPLTLIDKDRLTTAFRSRSQQFSNGPSEF